jgi:hypothetical protein
VVLHYSTVQYSTLHYTLTSSSVHETKPIQLCLPEAPRVHVEVHREDAQAGHQQVASAEQSDERQLEWSVSECVSECVSGGSGRSDECRLDFQFQRRRRGIGWSVSECVSVCVSGGSGSGRSVATGTARCGHGE